MKATRIAIAAGVAAAAAAALWWAFSPAPLSVETGEVGRRGFVRTIDDDGVTRVRDRYVVTSPVAGMLLRPELRAGDAVRRDATLARVVPSVPQMLDPRTRAELIARAEAAEARLARAAALVKQAEAALRQAELERRRIADLAQRSFASKTERERSELDVDLKRRSLEAAHFDQDAALHDAQQARAAARNGAGGTRDAGRTWVIRAPVDGRVLRLLRDSEGPVAAGESLLELGNVERLEAAIDLLSSEATQVPPGAPVSLRAGPGVQLSGRVRTIEPAAATKVSALGVEEQRVNVIVDLLPNPTLAGRVGDGFRVDAQIEVAREDDAILVPVAALYRDGESWAVFVDQGGVARRRVIETGSRDRDVAVVLKGLEAGERVVLYPGDNLRDGSRIRPLGDR
jgi:HlyD family secretion protein